MNDRICKVECCELPTIKHSTVCGSCKNRKTRYGSYTGEPKGRTYKGMSPQEKMQSLKNRFYMRINKTDCCHLWTGGKDKHGYGFLGSGANNPLKAHRVSWELHTGRKITKDIYICHTCDNPTCVNPDHLFEGTHQDNMTDMVKKGRSLTGEKSHRSKLKYKDVINIRILLASGEMQESIGRKYKVSRKTIYLIKTNRTWRHV